MNRSPAFLLLTLSLVLASAQAQAEEMVFNRINVGAMSFQSPLFSLFKEREKTTAQLDLGAPAVKSNLASYTISAEFGFTYHGWFVGMGLQGETLDSPPNDSSHVVGTLDSSGQIVPRRGELSNGGAYSSFARLGHLFSMDSDWKILPAIRVQSFQEDFEYQAFSLTGGSGVLPFRQYNRKHAQMQLSVSLIRSIGDSALADLEIYGTLSSAGIFNTTGSSFDSSGALLFENFKADTVTESTGIRFGLSVPMGSMELNSESLSPMVRMELGYEVQTMRLGEPDFLVLGPLQPAHVSLLRDLRLSSKSWRSNRAYISIGLELGVEY